MFFELLRFLLKFFSCFLTQIFFIFQFFFSNAFPPNFSIFSGKKDLLTSPASRTEDRMAEKQPMLSFAKVVSGLAGEDGQPQAQHTEVSQNDGQTEQPVQQSQQNSQKKDKENRNSDRPPRGEGKKRRNKKGDRKAKGEAKTEKQTEKAATEEVKPVEIPVVLEPAPLPAVNAWFKNKGNIFQNSLLL